MLLVDDYTRMTAVFFLRNKSEAFENFKVYKEMVENEMDSKIKCLRSDNTKDMQNEFEMSLLGELSFFLGL
jgi:hypothetical protein